MLDDVVLLVLSDIIVLIYIKKNLHAKSIYCIFIVQFSLLDKNILIQNNVVIN